MTLRRSAALLLACGGLCLAGCEGSAADSPALLELERLAWVAPDSCRIQGVPESFGNARALLVDRFELTRDQWRALMGPAPSGGLLALGTDPSEDRGTWPATGMTLDEAREAARRRDMRLLTAGEWIRVAVGSGAQEFPWEPVLFRSVANTVELRLGRPVDVGTFERGKTPLGTYEMLGNVWEWVEGRVRYPDDDLIEDDGWTLGGSYLSRLRPLFEPDSRGIVRFYRLELDPAHRALDLGMRCCVDAEKYLLEHCDEWGSGPAVRSRLLAIGRRFGPAATGLLEQLASRPEASPALAVLLEGSRG